MARCVAQVHLDSTVRLFICPRRGDSFTLPALFSQSGFATLTVQYKPAASLCVDEAETYRLVFVPHQTIDIKMPPTVYVILHWWLHLEPQSVQQ